MLRRIGINTVALSPGELRGLEPHANVDDIGAAAYEPESGYANPADTVEGLRRRAAELGAKLLQWTPVTKILRRESRVTGVETSTGRIDAGAVVVAAGAWAPRLCREIGLELPDRKSTRLNSSHSQISYAVFCLKKKKYYPPTRAEADWIGF